MVHAKMVAIFEMTKQPNLKDLPGKSIQRRIISHAYCFLTICDSEKLREIERRMNSSYHGSKISGSQLLFLT